MVDDRHGEYETETNVVLDDWWIHYFSSFAYVTIKIMNHILALSSFIASVKLVAQCWL